MAFKPYSTVDGAVIPWEYMPVAAITPQVGMALYESSGNLTTAAAGNLATYVSMKEASAAATAGDKIPVVRIQKDQVWESTLAANSTLAVGATTDIASGGLTVAASGSSGSNVEIVSFPDGVKTAGARVRVRFVK